MQGFAGGGRGRRAAAPAWGGPVGSELSQVREDRSRGACDYNWATDLGCRGAGRAGAAETCGLVNSRRGPYDVLTDYMERELAKDGLAEGPRLVGAVGGVGDMTGRSSSGSLDAAHSGLARSGWPAPRRLARRRDVSKGLMLEKIASPSERCSSGEASDLSKSLELQEKVGIGPPRSRSVCSVICAVAEVRDLALQGPEIIGEISGAPTKAQPAQRALKRPIHRRLSALLLQPTKAQPAQRALKPKRATHRAIITVLYPTKAQPAQRALKHCGSTCACVRVAGRPTKAQPAQRALKRERVPVDLVLARFGPDKGTARSKGIETMLTQSRYARDWTQPTKAQPAQRAWKRLDRVARLGIDLGDRQGTARSKGIEMH